MSKKLIKPKNPEFYKLTAEQRRLRDEATEMLKIDKKSRSINDESAEAPRIKPKQAARKEGRLNLLAVADALSLEGLDPAVEMVKILNTKIPVTTRDGLPVLDAEGKQVYVDAVDPETKLRTLNELLQYTQPKLKAVEMKVSGSLELSEEQLDERISAILEKAT